MTLDIRTRSPNEGGKQLNHLEYLAQRKRVVETIEQMGRLYAPPAGVISLYDERLKRAKNSKY